MNDSAKLLDILFLPKPIEVAGETMPLAWGTVTSRSFKIAFDSKPQGPYQRNFTCTRQEECSHNTQAMVAFESPESPNGSDIDYFKRIEADERAVFFRNPEHFATSLQNAGNISTLLYKLTGRDSKMLGLLEHLKPLRAGIVVRIVGRLQALEHFESLMPRNLLPVIRRRVYSEETFAWHMASEDLAEAIRRANGATKEHEKEKAEKLVKGYRRQIAEYEKNRIAEEQDTPNQEWIFEYLTLSIRHSPKESYRNPLVVLTAKADGGCGVKIMSCLETWCSLNNFRKNETILEILETFKRRLRSHAGQEELTFSPPWIGPNNTTQKPEGTGTIPFIFHEPIPKELLEIKTWESINSDAIPELGSLSIHTTLRGKAVNEKSMMQLHLDEAFQGVFNPVKNRIDGLATGMLSRVTLARQGAEWVRNTIQTLGYNLNLTQDVQTKIEKETLRNLRVRTPNYPLTTYEGIAYFRNTEYTAEESLSDPNDGSDVWISGKSYKILPSWERREIAVNQEIAEDPDNEEEETQGEESSFAPEVVVRGAGPSNAKETLSGEDQSRGQSRRTYVTHGYSVFHIESEKGMITVSEMDTEAGMGSRMEQLSIELETNQSLLNELNRNEKKRSNQVTLIKSLEEKIEVTLQDLSRTPISLEDFMRVFPPQPPPLATELYNEELSAKAKRIQKKFHKTFKIIPEQVMAASLASVKSRSILNCPPGGGKTLQAIMAAYVSDTHYWWVICPTKVMNTWVLEIDKAGFHFEVIGAEKRGSEWVETGRGYQQLRDIDKRCHNRVRIPGKDGSLGPEFFIISADVVSYGFGSNFQTDPWFTEYKLDLNTYRNNKQEILEVLDELPASLEGVAEVDQNTLRIWSNRMDNSHTIELLGLKGKINTRGIDHHHGTCPMCDEEKPFDAKGICGCKHMHSYQSTGESHSYKHWKLRWKSQGYSRDWIDSVPPNVARLEQKKVLRQHPGYKLMTKHVKGKIADEIHELAGITSQRGRAIQQVKTNRTILTTGTLCRTNVSELEAILSLTHQADCEAFPYRHWDLRDFREDFSSHMIVRETGNGRLSTTRKSIPEPSNITRLRGLLHGILCPISEASVEKSWGLKPIKEKIRYVELGAEQTQQTLDWNDLLVNLGERLRQNRGDMESRRQARIALGALKYAHESPQKIEEAVAWARETIRMEKRGVIVGPSRNMHVNLVEAFRELGIPFTEIDGSEGTHKRAKMLNHFRNSDCPILITRIRLVNTNYNQLTCCQRGLFLALDPSPAAVRQMQKRLNRIGQTQEVEWTFLISRLPLNLRYRSISGRNVLRIDEKAKYAIVEIPAGTVSSNVEEANTDEVVAAMIALREGATPQIGATSVPESNRATTQRISLRDYIISPEEAFLHLVLRREQSIQETTKRVTTPRSTGEIIEETRRREDFEETIKSILEAGHNIQEEEEDELPAFAGRLESLAEILEEAVDNSPNKVETTEAITLEVTASADTTEISGEAPEQPTTIKEKKTRTKSASQNHTATARAADQKAEQNHSDWESKMAAKIGAWKSPEEIAQENRGKRGKNRENVDQGFLFL